MSERHAPGWLVELQERLGAVLRTPLDRSSGVLRADTPAYDPAACDDVLETASREPAERLAVYNRQYWFRLFGVMQSEFPLAARLAGFWGFNMLSERYLLLRPPRGFDVAGAADGFADHLLREVAPCDLAPGVELPALREAAAIDEAWRHVSRAPEAPAYRPSAADAAALMGGRLRPAASWTLLDESWPLVELRRSLASAPAADERPLPLPPPLPSPRRWVLFRLPAGIGQLPLDPAEARLLALLREHPVGEALARLEAGCSQDERAALPGRVRGWLARSVELGLWGGLEP